MKRFLVFLFTFLLTTGSALAVDSYYLITEMEKLRDSLSLDDPSRIDLTLRLADLYFDVSIKEGKGEDYETLKKNRMKALELYQHSLNGTDGVKKATGMTRLKIKFQLARLLTRLEEFKQAEKYYHEVIEDKAVPERMKEQASLALAEWYEEEAKYTLAKNHYDVAINLCSNRSGCNYAHYRKAWLYFKDTKLNEAITEMKASLWSTDTEIRESSLQDLMLFMSNQATDGMAELAYINDLAGKLNRPELIHQLAEAFYVAGNRRAGSNLLGWINEHSPSLYFEVRLLEEVYGFRQWDKVENYLTRLEKRKAADIPTKKTHAEEVKKILRRYLVQIDSEAEVAPELKEFLKRSIDIYLAIYPNDDLRKKMQQGWLKAESLEEKRVERLGQWIKEDIAYGFGADDIRKLRQTRLSLAQKLKLSDIVIAEAMAIAKILKGTKEAEEFEYVAAREHYSRKEYDLALPLFQKLVKRPEGEWALLSQNLVLDIFNARDDFQKIMDQVALWKKLTADLDNKKIASENLNMDKLVIDARFAQAVKKKDDPASLQVFYDYCFAGIKADKSCTNAMVLAVKMADQEKIIKLLEKKGDEQSLMNEYELMGRYSDAARLQEKLVLKKAGNNASHELFLKIALLYELGNNLKERNRILEMLERKIKREKNIPEKLEPAIWITFKDAGMIDENDLFMPWSLKRRLALASRFELERPRQTTQKMIISQEKSTGPVWSRLVLGQIQKEFFEVSKIKFYGRYSKSHFKKRTKAINSFVNLAKTRLNGADLETRVYLLHMLERTYGQMVEDILATPLPPELDDATMAQVQMQLQSMSEPFDKVRADYDRLLQEHIAQLEEKKKAIVTSNLAKNIEDYVSLIEINREEPRVLAELDRNIIDGRINELGKTPGNKKILGELKEYFVKMERPRLAAYYTGRLEGLEIKK